MKLKVMDEILWEVNGMTFKADGDLIFVYAKLSDTQQQLVT